MRKKRTKTQLHRVAAIDEQYHALMLVLDRPRLDEQKVNAELNCTHLDRMPPKVRIIINELGPEVPDWINEWLLTGRNPRARNHHNAFFALPPTDTTG